MDLIQNRVPSIRLRCIPSTISGRQIKQVFKFSFLQEIALISEEARRTATIICRERVEVLVVNRETILEYCPDVFQREYEEKLQVMR